MTPSRLSGSCTRVIFPASILLKSRISFRMYSSEALLSLIILAYPRCSSSSSVSVSRSVMPIMPFIGVRSSWLIMARNSDLA
ncbi:hypothetical protein D3C85_1769120 [compost metagenome]